MDLTKEYDFVVFGATGFTGQYVCKELLKQSRGAGQKTKIAVAGRNRGKLNSVVDWLCFNKESSSVVDIGVIEANVDDDQSLLNMCRQCKIILDCVGPYKFYGEAVVKACVEESSDYIDITGEPGYIEKIHSKYHEKAIAKGVYIVNACGFDYIPSDMGVVFAKKKFSGTLATVENYFTLISGREGMKLNYGTYASLVHSISDARNRGKFSGSKRGVGVCGPKMKLKGIHYGPQGALAFPFGGGDGPVVKKSQQYYYDNDQEIPAQFSMYANTGWVNLLALLFFFVVVKLLSSFALGKKMLLRYPEFFSGGFFGKEGPNEQQMCGCGFEFMMYCTGYSEHVTVEHFINGDLAKKAHDTKMTVKISGPEVAYVTTPITMVQSGMCLKEERSLMPARGGVYTPGPAFKNSTLIERLNRNGICFEVV